MSIEISFRGQSIEAVSLQVKEILKGTTLTRKKVVGCCQTIFDSQEREASAVKFLLKKMKMRLFDKDRKDAAFGVFAEKVWECVKVVPGDSIDRLPVEILKQVLRSLPDMRRVSPQLNAAAKAITLERMQNVSFGAVQWKEFVGAEVGEEPPLPSNIMEILAEDCPFSANGRMVAETHLLTLIPETINGQPLNLMTLERLFKAKFPSMGNGTGYKFICLSLLKTPKNHGKSSWMLMTRDVIEGSKGKRFAKQQALIAERGQNKYEVPPALDVATCIFLEYVRTNGQTRLFDDRPVRYTRCQEKDAWFQVVVGNFVPAGLSIFGSDFVNDDEIGIAAMRKL